MKRVRWFPWAFALAIVVLGIGIMRLDVGAVLFGMLALLLGIVGLIADRRSRRRLNSRANRET
jgi:hypothetical protein